MGRGHEFWPRMLGATLGMLMAAGLATGCGSDDESAGGGADEDSPSVDTLRVGTSCVESVDCETANRITLRSDDNIPDFGVVVTSPTTFCSPVRYRLQLDDAEEQMTEIVPWTPTGSTETDFDIDFGPLGPGDHVLSVSVQGAVEGCNSGDGLSWTGRLTLPAGVTVVYQTVE